MDAEPSQASVSSLQKVVKGRNCALTMSIQHHRSLPLTNFRYPPSIFILLMMLIEVNNRYPKFLPTDAEEDKECLSIVTRLVMLINTIYRTWGMLPTSLNPLAIVAYQLMSVTTAMCCPRWQRFAQGVPLLQHNLSMDEHARVSLGLGCHSPIPGK